MGRGDKELKRRQQLEGEEEEEEERRNRKDEGRDVKTGARKGWPLVQGQSG